MKNLYFNKKNNELGVLGEPTTVTQLYLDIQTIPFKQNARFYSFYPISGGAMVVDLNEVEERDPPTLAQLDRLLGRNGYGFNPAAKTIGLILEDNICKAYDTEEGRPEKREHVYKCFDSERTYQTAKWGTHEHPRAQFVVDIERHLNQLKDHCYNLDEKNMQEEVRKIGALAVKFGEVHGMAPRMPETGE